MMDVTAHQNSFDPGVFLAVPQAWALLSSNRLANSLIYHSLTTLIIDPLEWVRTFSVFLGKKILTSKDLKMGKFVVKKLLPFYIRIKFNKCVS